MADHLIIRTDDGTFRVPTDALEPYRVDEPEVTGFDLGSFADIGVVMRPVGGLSIQPEEGGEDLFAPRSITPRAIGETEKNLGRPPWG